jgi:hypothetical protein
MTLTNDSYLHEEHKSRLNLGNVCYSLVQNLSSSHVLSENVMIKVYRTVMLHVPRGCITLCVVVREGQMQSAFEQVVLQKIFVWLFIVLVAVLFVL